MSRHSLLTILALGIWLLGLPLKVMTQDAPLFIQGGFEDATATDDSYNTGGTISLNGFTITVPTNVLVQFPAAWVPWKDFVEDKEAMIGYEINVSRAASVRTWRSNRLPYCFLWPCDISICWR